jgi:mRNA interferase YafQ
VLKLKRHKQFEKLVRYLSLLIDGKPLPPEAKDHPLIGDWKGFREFHLGGDLLVIYRKTLHEVILVRIGSHNQLFE